MHSLTPICKDRIWGSKHLANSMGIETECEHPGEIFCVNALPEDDVLVDNEIPLSKFYQENKSLFHLPCSNFPLRVNLIEANEDLSIQVHPNESYARLYEHAKGLPEAWVILESDNAYLRLGHTCSSRSELESIIHDHSILESVPKIEAKKDMFFHLKPGTIHAIGKGCIVYEVSHMADITYRLYDYGRIDAKSKKPRKLHIKKALDNIYYPQKVTPSNPIYQFKNEHYERITYIDEPGLFTIEKLNINDNCALSLHTFCIITIISGNGRIDHTKVDKGQTWLKLYDGTLTQFFGEMVCIISSYKEK